VGHGVPLTIAGRDCERATAFARELGANCQGIAADVTDSDSCGRALAGHRVAVHCAGPFRESDVALLDACVAAKCHYIDIADDRGYVREVRGRKDQFRQRQRSAIYGASSMPGISQALCRLLCVRFGKPRRIRVSLFIGNRNPKGLASLASCVRGLGRPISTPTGPVTGSRDRVEISLPEPFGRRATYNFSTPDFDLLPDEFGVDQVEVKVGFESRLGSRLLALLARIGSGYGRRTARFLRALAWPMQWLGSSGGAVSAEFFLADGRTTQAALVARERGQRMAALPTALAAQALLREESPTPGAGTVSDLLGHDRFLAQIQEAGFELHADG
jgi:hypothetical protein